LRHLPEFVLLDDNAADDKSKHCDGRLEKQGLEKRELDKSDAHDSRNAGVSDLRTVESQRTNASNGSLQDRQRLMAGQDESIEIVGFESSASRHSKLREKDLLEPAAKPVDSSKSLPQSLSTDDGLERPIIEYRPEQVGAKTFSLGLAYEENRTFSRKMTDFAIGARGRLLDPEDQKAYAQQQIDKILGIGEGLNIAKESTKLAAVSAWKALTDGSVASFLAKPNAINDPLFKAVGGTFDAMAKDPNLVNKVLVALEHQIALENDKYSAMEPREKGRFIGEVMFAMFNPEGSSEAGEASLKMADRLASRVDKGEGYLGDLRGEVKAGAGGRWDVLNERASPDVVQQAGRMSCVSACGEMLTEGAIKQRDLLDQLGAPVATKYLARVLGPMWDGGPVDEAALDVHLHRGSWVADLRERMGMRYARLEPAHAVIVDGVDSSGNIMIRDPAQATRYEMTRYEFIEAWTGVAVFRK
jgi:hypothetical protein